MHVDLAQGLLIAAVAANGLLSGASGDQSVKQLPARRRIGAVALIVATVGHRAVTAVAAPTNISQRRQVGSEAALTRLFDRFERLQTVVEVVP
ncbi:MAG: hypothetical protein V7603_620 [Micromonosporaceae bacterium]